MDGSLAVLALVVFGAYGVQTVSGFGSVVVALTFGAHLYDIPHLLAMIVPLSFIQCGYIAVRHHAGIDWRILVRRIIPLMGVGMVAGLWVAEQVHGDELRTAFALLVLVLATRELYVMWRARGGELPSGLAAPIWIALVIGAGVVHGIYATGGPMLVYAVSRSGLRKHAFRSTLTVLWLILNVALVVQYARAGRLTGPVFEDMLWLAPAVPAGIVIGEYLHARVDERRFRIFAFCLLAFGAVSLLAR